MSILSNISLARLFKTAYKPASEKLNVPFSAQRAIERANQPQPFNINRDAHGTRPWHTYRVKNNKI
jgi:hypothetical protein